MFVQNGNKVKFIINTHKEYPAIIGTFQNIKYSDDEHGVL